MTFKYGKHSIITQESAIFPIKMFVSCSCYIVAIRKIPWSTFNLEKRLKTKRILLLNLYLDTLSQRYATFLDRLTLLDRNGPSCFPLRQGNLLLLPPPLAPFHPPPAQTLKPCGDEDCTVLYHLLTFIPYYRMFPVRVHAIPLIKY